jgi:N-acetylmuramoyl-L-alanine amidase
MGEALWHPSPNYTERRGVSAPDLVLIHYTAMHSAEAARERLCDAAAEVSAHYLIAEDGRLWQLVADQHRAWHAGQGAWAGRGDVNSRSIGIELANRGTHPFPEPQMRVLEDLLRRLMARWAIPPAGVLGHSDTAPGRKIDPGPRFDWQRLARQGLALWPEAGAPGDFAADCARVGYDVAAVPAETLLAAFRLRFRPWARGPLDDTDRALAGWLAARAPA